MKSVSFSTNRISPFIEFATKPDLCRYSLKNRITDSDQGIYIQNYKAKVDHIFKLEIVKVK